MKYRYAIMISNKWINCCVDKYYSWNGNKKKW